MPKNHMPVAHYGVRPENLRAECAPPQAFEKWRPELVVRAEAGADDNGAIVIDVLDVIGETWDGEGVTAKKVSAVLRGAANRPVIVNVNSPGGDMFDGLAIYNLLRNYEGDVTVRVLGVAASAASVIAMAGDRVEIAKTGFLMIHNAWVFAIGDRHDLSTVAGQLAVFDGVMADLYAQRTGIDAAEIGSRMDREFWIAGKPAVEQGFADDLLPADLIGVSASTKAQASTMQRDRRIEAGMALMNMTRAERRAYFKEHYATPSAGEDGTPGAAESLNALNRSFASFLGR